MITPSDMQNKKFIKIPFGYQKADVDDFFEQLKKDYEKIYLSNLESGEKIKSLERTVQSYKSMEETMKNTLLVAQTTADKLTSAAKKDAAAIVGEADRQSKEIIGKAKENLEKLTHEYEKIKKEISVFILQTKADFETQIKVLDETRTKLDKTEL